MSLTIAGIGTAVPRHSIGQSEAAELSRSFCVVEPRRERLLAALYRRTGVERRHSVLLESADGESGTRQSFYPPARDADDQGPTTHARMAVYEAEAPTLAVEAARRAIDDAGIDPASFSHTVTVSCTGFHAPGLDAALIHELDLPPTVERTHVGFMGCHGALNGLRVARSFARSEPQARVLVVAVELCSLHFFYGWDAEKLVANALFADGAGALVGVGEAADGEAARGEDDWLARAHGTYVMPDSADAMTWRIGDHGFHMTLSARVPDLIRRHVRDWLVGWLGQHGLGIGDVGSWAVHPGGPRILSAFHDAVGLDEGALAVSREVLADFGNMSSATVVFILERLRRRGLPRPCVALGFGPGLVVEAALLA